MNAAKKTNANPESYSPRTKPLIMSVAEEASRSRSKETAVEQVHEYCSIVDRSETRIVGIGVTITYESRGYSYGGGAFTGNCLTDFEFAQKVIRSGDIALLAEVLGIDLTGLELISARYDIGGDGNYKVLVGFEVESLPELPPHLPEYADTLTVPVCRFAKMLINEQRQESRTGYEERMHADAYFIDGFRNDTQYVYNQDGCPMNTYDLEGRILTKYEPVKIPKDELERYDSMRFKTVTLPEMKIACAVAPLGTGVDAIMKYFEIEQQVYAVESARYYLHDYYGFPFESKADGKVYSCFGTRVSSFDGLPDIAEQMTLPGGIYLHITQLEFNGDNPSIPYDVAFNKLEMLYLSAHPQYEFDRTRKVIARFRQNNCASVFVPLSLK
ncbi:hypothetical protein [Paenibacillus macerans]|uniref:hypothetical protein n=1 Tax=Paenibacillus macerans TaxID=44252 RepID=UPI003D311C3D